MKFIFIAPRFHTNFYYPIKALLDHGHQVEFAALYKGKSEHHDLVKPVILGYASFFKILNKLFNPAGGKLIKNTYELRYGFPPLFRFFCFLSKSESEFIVVKDLATTYALISFVFGFLLRKKIIVFTQIPKFRQKPPSQAVKWLGLLLGVQAITPVLGDRGYKNTNDNLVYIPFTAPIHQKSKTSYSSDKTLVLMCVGKFQERKNQLLLLQAVNLLKSEFSLKVWLMGQEDEGEYLAAIKSYIAENTLESLVDIFPNIPWEDTGEYYQQADIFILPSYAEAASYAVVEAMSYGLPVLSSTDNGTHCYIENGKNGFTFNPFDLTDLVSKLRWLMSDYDRLLQMGQFNITLMESSYSLKSFYKQFMTVIESYYD